MNHEDRRLTTDHGRHECAARPVFLWSVVRRRWSAVAALFYASATKVMLLAQWFLPKTHQMKPFV